MSSTTTELETFKSNFKWGDQEDKVIQSVDANSNNSATSSLNNFTSFSTDTSNSPLEPYTNGTYNQVKSFLRITTSRVEYTGGKWYGSLTGYGSFKYKNKGFVTFNTASTSDEGKKLILTGGFYLVEKNNEGNNGTIKYKSEIDKSKNKEITKETFDERFPKPYWYTKKGGFDKYYGSNGRFIKGAQDLDNICTTNNSGTNKCEGQLVGSNSQTFSWEGLGGGGYDNNCGTWTEMGWCDYVGAGSSNKEQYVGKVHGGDYMYDEGGNNFSHRLSSFKGYGKELSIPRKISK